MPRPFVHEELRLTESLNGLRRRLKFMRFRSIGNEGVNIDFIAADGLGKFFKASKVTATFSFPSSGTSAVVPQPARANMVMIAVRSSKNRARRRG